MNSEKMIDLCSRTNSGPETDSDSDVLIVDIYYDDVPVNPIGRFEVPIELRNTLEVRKCEFCHSAIVETDCYLRWQGLDFCVTLCLESFWFTFLDRCSFHMCNSRKIPINRVGCFVKWCGPLLRGFCGSSCITLYLKSLKKCAHCCGQIYIENSQSIVCVEDSMDFCSIDCWMSETGNSTAASRREPRCRMCGTHGKKYKVLENTNVEDICSDECLLHFQTNFNLVLRKCTQCLIRFDSKSEGYVFFDVHYQPFPVCSDVCRSHLIKARHKTVEKCSFCRESKDSIGYIYKHPRLWRTDFDLLCSLDCLARRVTARRVPVGVCSWCCLSKRTTLYYCLTDGSTHYFCSKNCSNLFLTSVERTFYQPIIGWPRIISNVRTRDPPPGTSSIQTTNGSRWRGTLELLD